MGKRMKTPEEEKRVIVIESHPILEELKNGIFPSKELSKQYPKYDRRKHRNKLFKGAVLGMYEGVKIING